jgi:hypothetical protein
MNNIINKAWENWYDKNHPTRFNIACNDSRKRQEEGRKQIEDKLDKLDKLNKQNVKTEPNK